MKNRNKYGFIFLLFFLLLLIAFFPLLSPYPIYNLIFKILITFVLICSVYGYSQNPLAFWIGIAILIPTIALNWLSYFYPTTSLMIANDALVFIFLSYSILIFIKRVFYTEKITLNTIYGTTCIYLLLGFTWAMLFSLLEITNPGSFLGNMEISDPTIQTENLIYFSFVTLTTLGYGDIFPATQAAKFLSITEALLGQLYIATAIARIVGMYLKKAK